MLCFGVAFGETAWFRGPLLQFFIVQKNDAEHAEKFQSERKKVKEMNKIDYLFIVAH